MMKYLIVGLVLLSCGCRKADLDLKRATCLKIRYTVKGGDEWRYLEVRDRREVQSLLDTLEITKTMPNAFATLYPNCTIDFIYPDGQIVETLFVARDQIERRDFGQVWIKPGFHDKLCEIISKKEGRKIEILNKN